MEKLIVQSRASINDTPFKEIIINDKSVNFLEYFHNREIRTLKEDLISSCHGNNYISQEQALSTMELSKAGHNIVAIMYGGMIFAKPSVDAALMPTVPVISIPSDYLSFLSVCVPSGVAAVAGVGIDNFTCAARVTSEILNKKFGGVYLNNTQDKIARSLEKYKVGFLGIANGEHSRDGIVISKLNIGNGMGLERELSDIDKMGRIVIAVPGDLNVWNIGSFSSAMKKAANIVYTKGEENAVVLAAKFMANYNGEARNALLDESKRKRESYDGNRKITFESFYLGEKNT